MRQGRGMRHSWIAAALLVVLLIAFRIVSAIGFLPNFSPLPALLLCSLVFLRGARAWLLPLAAWAITDPLVSLVQGYPVIGPHHVGILVGLSASVALGYLLRRDPRNLPVLAGSLASAGLFFLLSNSFSFLFDPLYAKTLTGFIQAQWTGPEGFAPTWVFLRNAGAANLLFTGLFLAARRSWMPALSTAPGTPASPLR